MGKVYYISGDDNFTDVIAEEQDLLSLDEMKFSPDLINELKTMKEKDRMKFIQSSQKHYIAACTYLKAQLKIKVPGNILSALQRSGEIQATKY